MKYLNVILTLIVFCLATIALRLYTINLLLTDYNYSAKLIVNSHQSLINSNKHLEDEILSLRQQVEAFRASFEKK